MPTRNTGILVLHGRHRSIRSPIHGTACHHCTRSGTATRPKQRVTEWSTRSSGMAGTQWMAPREDRNVPSSAAHKSFLSRCPFITADNNTFSNKHPSSSSSSSTRQRSEALRCAVHRRLVCWLGRHRLESRRRLHVLIDRCWCCRLESGCGVRWRSARGKRHCRTLPQTMHQNRQDTGHVEGSLYSGFDRFPHLRDKHSHIHGKMLHQTRGTS